MSQSTRNIAQYLELSKLQMTAEAFWDQWTNKKGYSKKNWEQDLTKTEEEGLAIYSGILTEGNGHASRFPEADIDNFYANYEVVAHRPNTSTGFSGTLFRAKQDNP